MSWILPRVGADASANIANIAKDISGDAYDKLVQNYQNLEQYTRDYPVSYTHLIISSVTVGLPQAVS